jgi:hypothetical protein
VQVFINPKDANNRDITWHNSVALEGYVKRLSIVAVSANATAVALNVAWFYKFWVPCVEPNKVPTLQACILVIPICGTA